MRKLKERSRFFEKKRRKKLSLVGARAAITGTG
jgi:hypothetical protein